MGLSKSESSPDFELLASFIRKARDKSDKRYFFVPDPIKLQVNNVPIKSVTLNHHPTENLGNRTIELSDEFTSATSPLLPDEIRQRTQENLLPPKIVAPLAKELSKLPENLQNDLRSILKESPDVDSIKEVTIAARCIGKTNDASLSLRALQRDDVDLDKATQEAQRIDALGYLADALTQAKSIEAAVLRLHSSWRRLGDINERLFF